MSILAFAAIFPTGAGVVVSGTYVTRYSARKVVSCVFHSKGWVQETLGWRWIEWIAMCLSGTLTVWLVVYGAQETRGSILLMRRAKRLGKETGDPRYRVPFDPPDMRQLIWISCTRSICKLSIRRPGARAG
jgi:hypothetical protein